MNTDGWKGTQAAWKALFQKVVILRCFLHGWLKIRDRAKHLKDLFAEVSRQVWEAYHAARPAELWATLASAPGVGERTPQRGRLGERPRSVPQGRRFSVAYRFPGGHRTSNMLDRQMRGMNRYFDHGQHLHGSHEACRRHCLRVGLAVELHALAPGNYP